MKNTSFPYFHWTHQKKNKKKTYFRFGLANAINTYFRLKIRVLSGEFVFYIDNTWICYTKSESDLYLFILKSLKLAFTTNFDYKITLWICGCVVKFTKIKC